MAKSTLSARLADFAAAARADGVPDEVAVSVRQRVLDILGLCVAAHRLPTSAAAIRYVFDQGGSPQAHLVGAPTRVTVGQAAFVNGVLAHSLDYDDTHLPSVLHPSASVVPAALAVAEHVGSTGSALVRAIAVGLEVTVRLGMAGYDTALRNSIFFEHGQHATSICGAMGAAVAAGMLYDLDADRLRDTLGIAASMAAGVIEANRTGGTVKRLHCGWAAQSGVAAAQLVRHGFTGPPTALEGRFGFFEAFLHGRYQPAEITEGLGESWAVPGIFFKPYPANHFTHAAIDAGMSAATAGIRIDEITSMTLAVPSAVVRTIGQPLDAKRAPDTGYQAQFSGPYAVTAGLLGGSGLGVGLDDFTDELAKDPLRRALMATVDVVPDARCDEIFPFQFPAILTVRTPSGASTFEVLTNRGGPHRPLSDGELTDKFANNTAGRLPDETVRQIAQIVQSLDRQSGVETLMYLVSQPHLPSSADGSLAVPAHRMAGGPR